LPDILSNRSQVTADYDRCFGEESPVQRAFELRKGTEWNHAYYPVLFDFESRLLRVLAALNRANIFPRRYFYPLLDVVTPSLEAFPVARDIASRILCLPISTGMEGKAGDVGYLVKESVR